MVTFFFAISALLIVHVPQPEKTEEGQAGKGNLFKEALYGFKYIFARRSLVRQQQNNPNLHNSPAMRRRIIFIELSASHGELTSPFDDFGINITRTPLFFVDVHLHTGEILQSRDTPIGSGWGTVPTPMF